MFLAWKHSGNEMSDPYRLYNGLDASYRPLAHPEQAPCPPVYPTRLRHFIYGCGLFAAEYDSKLAGAQQQARAVRAMGG